AADRRATGGAVSSAISVIPSSLTRGTRAVGRRPWAARLYDAHPHPGPAPYRPPPTAHRPTAPRVDRLAHRAAPPQLQPEDQQRQPEGHEIVYRRDAPPIERELVPPHHVQDEHRGREG